MSAPGVTHERLRIDLDALAVLSGHREQLHLADWLRPDVARCDLLDLRLFVGDAKDTERPTNPDSVQRLRAYLAAAARATRVGWTATFAIAHQNPSAPWLDELEWLAGRLGLAICRRGRDVFAVDAAVSWIVIGTGAAFQPGELQG
jgi:hypothetical protein